VAASSPAKATRKAHLEGLLDGRAWDRTRDLPRVKWLRWVSRCRLLPRKCTPLRRSWVLDGSEAESRSNGADAGCWQKLAARGPRCQLGSSAHGCSSPLDWRRRIG
jgi:hypothetical protein